MISKRLTAIIVAACCALTATAVPAAAQASTKPRYATKTYTVHYSAQKLARSISAEATPYDGSYCEDVAGGAITCVGFEPTDFEVAGRATTIDYEGVAAVPSRVKAAWKRYGHAEFKVSQGVTELSDGGAWAYSAYLFDGYVTPKQGATRLGRHSLGWLKVPSRTAKVEVYGGIGGPARITVKDFTVTYAYRVKRS